MIEMNRTKLQIDSEVRPRLTNLVKPKLLARGDQLLKTADTELQTAETALATNNVTEAFRHAQFSLRNLRDGARLLDQCRGEARAGQQSVCGHVCHVAPAFQPDHERGKARGAWPINCRKETSRTWGGPSTRAGSIISTRRKVFAKRPSFRRISTSKGKHSLRLAATAIDPEAPPDQTRNSARLDHEPADQCRAGHALAAARPGTRSHAASREARTGC